VLRNPRAEEEAKLERVRARLAVRHLERPPDRARVAAGTGERGRELSAQEVVVDANPHAVSVRERLGRDDCPTG
jgi:hypothetical protein